MVARLVIHLSVRPAMASRGDASRFPLDDFRHTTGFTIKGKCRSPDECFSPSGIRITFVPATTAAGVLRGAFQTAVMFDAQNAPISTPPPSAAFVGYQSAVPIDHAEFKHVFSGARLARLVYRRCL
jgi:hypothetical protein